VRVCGGGVQAVAAVRAAGDPEVAAGRGRRCRRRQGLQPGGPGRADIGAHPEEVGGGGAELAADGRVEEEVEEHAVELDHLDGAGRQVVLRGVLDRLNHEDVGEALGMLPEFFAAVLDQRILPLIAGQFSVQHQLNCGLS
jgi:hypothetical protein